MTSLAEAAPKSRARGRLVWVALALSLTLNVFFVFGLLWFQVAGQPRQTPAERVAALASELNLTAEQRGAFQQFVNEVQERSRRLRESNQPLIQQVWDELAKPQPDQALIARLVDEATENRHTYQKNMAGVLSQFLAALSPEQRAQFVELAKRPQDKRASHIRLAEARGAVPWPKRGRPASNAILWAKWRCPPSATGAPRRSARWRISASAASACRCRSSARWRSRRRPQRWQTWPWANSTPSSAGPSSLPPTRWSPASTMTSSRWWYGRPAPVRRPT